MAFVECHVECLALPVRILQCRRDKIPLVVDTAVVAQREGPVVGRMADGAPQVDNLEPLLEEFGSVLSGSVTVNTCGSGLGSLIDVDKRNGLTFGRTVIKLTGAATTDG